MARSAGAVASGHPHRVTQRGIRFISIFHTDGDRRAYLDVMVEEVDCFDVEVLASVRDDASHACDHAAEGFKGNGLCDLFRSAGREVFWEDISGPSGPSRRGDIWSTWTLAHDVFAQYLKKEGALGKR